MRLFLKGLAVVGLAVFSVVSFNSAAHAEGWFGGFFGGGGQSGQTSSPDSSSSSGGSGGWSGFFNSGGNSAPSPNNPSPNPSPNPSTQNTPAPASSDDADKDGLTAVQEAEQGTSDTNKDSDGDGIPDFVESRWNPNRNALFCGSVCAYPDPTKKDIYLEVDWMVRPTGESMKPTDQQVKMLTDAFAKENINLHIDTGQYGGGNPVPYNPEIWFGTTANEVDFVDYKHGGDGIAAQFNAQRNNAWHYMIVGERYKRIVASGVSNGSSGVANASGPNTFVAYGVMSQRGRDLALAGTMMHELGHNLCLMPSQATANSGCGYAGIDNNDAAKSDYAYKGYKSSMNYMYQMQLVDYAHNPTNAPGNHDDWASLQLDGFAKYSENANGQSKEAAPKDKIRNNTLSNFNM